MNDIHDVEFRALLDACCADTITPEQLGQLESILVNDPHARRLYDEYMQMNVELRFLAHARRAEKRNTLRSTSAIDEAAAVIIEEKPTSLLRRRHRYDSIRWQFHKFRFSTLSAVLTALAWIGFSYFVWFSTTPDDSRPNRDGVNVNFVARITGQYEHRWAESTRGIPWHAFLVPGERLNLVEGLIEITYYDGAVVVLEGPTEFVVDSAGAGTLSAGRLTAKVPPQAIGFVVDTPSVQVTDLGTEFGVQVLPGGATFAEVYVGMVEVATAVRDASGTSIRRLRAGDAVRIGTNESGEMTIANVQRDRRLALTRSLPVSLVRNGFAENNALIDSADYSSEPPAGWVEDQPEGTEVGVIGEDRSSVTDDPIGRAWIHLQNASARIGQDIGAVEELLERPIEIRYALTRRTNESLTLCHRVSLIAGTDETFIGGDVLAMIDNTTATLDSPGSIRSLEQTLTPTGSTEMRRLWLVFEYLGGDEHDGEGQLHLDQLIAYASPSLRTAARDDEAQ